MVTRAQAVQELGRPVAYYASLGRIFGVEEAVFLGQLIYWSDKGRDERGWIYKEAKEWETELGMSYKRQATARRTLKSAGVLEEKHDRLHHKLFFKINWDAYNRALEEGVKDVTFPKVPTGLSGKADSGFRESPNRQFVNIGTETTAETTDREEEPIALEGLSDSSSKNLPATPGEPKAPPASTTVPAVRDYPKQPSGRADRLAILKAHYADPADRLAKLYRYFEWDQETARQFITRRENGSLPDKTINLLTRYLHNTSDMSGSLPASWYPGSMDKLLSTLKLVVPVVRRWVRETDLDAAATDLASISWGHHGTTHTVLTQAESWVADHPGHLPLDACGDSFIKWPLWAIRVCLAQQGQHFDIDPEEIPRLAEEVADDPLIPIMSFWGTLDPVKVLGLSMDEIRALNKTRVADRQARVDDLKSLL